LRFAGWDAPQKLSQVQFRVAMRAFHGANITRLLGFRSYFSRYFARFSRVWHGSGYFETFWHCVLQAQLRHDGAMARVPTDIKRLFVRVLAEKVKAGEATLSGALLAIATSQFDVISSGEICIARSGDGFSGTFSIPNPAASAGVTPIEIAALASELLDLYDNCNAFLTKCAANGLDPDTVDADGWPDPLAPVTTPAAVTDASIATRMLSKLIQCDQTQEDYFLLRCGPGLQSV
jgi:hypothetical protein